MGKETLCGTIPKQRRYNFGMGAPVGARGHGDGDVSLSRIARSRKDARRVRTDALLRRHACSEPFIAIYL